jgi:Mrp family chromosome partitioning ATPase
MPSPVPGLDVLPAGAEGADAARILRPGVFRDVVSTMAKAYASVIVLLPAVDSWADGRVIAADTEGVVLVSRIGGSDRASLKRAYDALVASRARVLGTVAFGG